MCARSDDQSERLDSELEAVRKAVPETSLMANTGVKLETVTEMMDVAEGSVIGTPFNERWENLESCDPRRVERFMECVLKSKITYK